MPIALDDRTVKMLGVGAIQDSTGPRDHDTNAVTWSTHIMEQDRGAGRLEEAAVLRGHRARAHGLRPVLHARGSGVPRQSRHACTASSTCQATRRRSVRDVQVPRAVHGRRLVGHARSTRTRTPRRCRATTPRRTCSWRSTTGARARSSSRSPRWSASSRMFPDYTEVLVPLGGFYMDRRRHREGARAVPTAGGARSRRIPRRTTIYGVTLMYQGHAQQALPEFDAADRARSQLQPALLRRLLRAQAGRGRTSARRAICSAGWICIPTTRRPARCWIRKPAGSPASRSDPLPPPPPSTSLP